MKAYINNKEVEFTPGETILSVAKRNAVYIPTLCAYLPLDHTPGTCRVCLVEVDENGEKKVLPSCLTPLKENMRVRTNTNEVRGLRRRQVQWILADHNQDCASCNRHGNCELQDAALACGLKDNSMNGRYVADRPIDASANGLVLDASKCIRCGRCVEVCRQIQGVSALGFEGIGTETRAGIVGAKLWVDSKRCVQCGQCSLVCPVGAISEKDEIETALDWFNDPEIKTVIAFAPAVRVTLGEEFSFPQGLNVEKRIVTALKALGADFVCDVNWAADVTILEEGTEFIGRLKEHGTFPMMTSCCPGWINFVEKLNPEVIPNISSTRSPQAIFGSLAKTYFAKKKGIDPKKLKFISIMPCTAKKDERTRDQLSKEGCPDTDLVLTVRELARLLKSQAVDLNETPESEFDSPVMSENTGAAAIFGATGGVMEAALRTVHAVLMKESMPDLNFTAVRGMQWLKEASVDLGSYGTVRIAVVHGLNNAQKVVDEIKAGKSKYHFIEVMACPGGCINGGGTARVKNDYLARSATRMKGIYEIDEKRTLRESHKNPEVQTLYREFLGSPCSELSHELLHTHYKNKKTDEVAISIESLRDKIKLA